MSLTLQNPLKDPSAVLDYVFDWTEWLATGETIADYTITADTGITVDSSTKTTGKVTIVWLSGGTAGINYKGGVPDYNERRTNRRAHNLDQGGRKVTGTILVVLSDTHIGSSTAVSPLRFTVHNRSTYEAQVMEANRLQKWLYRNWLDFFSMSRNARNIRIIVAHLGDVIDYNHHGSTQLVQEVGDQVVMAKECCSLTATWRTSLSAYLARLLMLARITRLKATSTRD